MSTDLKADLLLMTRHVAPRDMGLKNHKELDALRARLQSATITEPQPGPATPEIALKHLEAAATEGFYQLPEYWTAQRAAQVRAGFVAPPPPPLDPCVGIRSCRSNGYLQVRDGGSATQGCVILTRTHTIETDGLCIRLTIEEGADA